MRNNSKANKKGVSKLSHNLSISEQLTYSTVRIECKDNEGNISTGTGFFIVFVKMKKISYL